MNDSDHNSDRDRRIVTRTHLRKTVLFWMVVGYVLATLTAAIGIAVAHGHVVYPCLI